MTCGICRKKKCQEKGSDMSPVHVGVGHDDDPLIAELRQSSESPMPAPRAITSGRMFSLETILSSRAFSTLRSLPRSGRIAWKRRSRPCLAEPPAESPSTR